MKSMSITLAAAIFLLSAAPAFSQTQAEKDECMLAMKNCTDQVDDIYKRMHRLDKEIKKGKKVYTPAELKKLQQKLAETEDLLKSMEKPGK
jgi:peptidoglycan hydrolase CwlO-like protein